MRKAAKRRATPCGRLRHFSVSRHLLRLLVRAAQKYGIDLRRSYMAGDRWRDVDAGAGAGCRTIFIDCGYNEKSPIAEPDARVATLPDAVEWILNHARESHDESR